MANAVQSSHGLKWWQWFLVFPVVLVTLITAIPEWIERVQAFQSDVRLEVFREKDRSQKLWERNYRCSAADPEWHANKDNVKVDATICESGDIMAVYVTTDNERHYGWIDHKYEISKVETTLASELISSLLASAHAAETSESMMLAQGAVLCQRWLPDGRGLKRRISTRNGCFDEFIDTYTGRVMRTVPAPCNGNC